VNAGVTVVLDNGNNGQGSVAAAVAEYLEETRINKKPRTFAAYSAALDYRDVRACRIARSAC
jgi:hypothetical protein